ncbi:hypothetical protein OHA18_31250 [Kribbella sp. NBC_00709]|uniref:hypothetical protein n=1 Tax=Kribbella sp. NBC_00709 TaxID=2975972 RepID=UPI002E2C2F8C|nr:hypothetical protein [Kribbella sp. NBC_00709]
MNLTPGDQADLDIPQDGRQQPTAERERRPDPKRDATKTGGDSEMAGLRLVTDVTGYDEDAVLRTLVERGVVTFGMAYFGGGPPPALVGVDTACMGANTQCTRWRLPECAAVSTRRLC